MNSGSASIVFDKNSINTGRLAIVRPEIQGHHFTYPTHPAFPLPGRYASIHYFVLSGYAVERSTGKEGLTVAGLLMFGKGLEIPTQSDPLCPI